LNKCKKNWNFPVFFKLNEGDGALGVSPSSVCHNINEAKAQLERLHLEFPDKNILIQEFLEGEEFTIGVMGNINEFTFLPPIRNDYSILPEGYPHITTYEINYQTYTKIGQLYSYKLASDEELPPEHFKLMQKYTSLLFERLQCKDYARFDFRYNEKKEIKLLEVNPNPAWCWDGRFVNGFKLLNPKYNYATFLMTLLKIAESRFKKETNLIEETKKNSTRAKRIEDLN